MYSAPARSVLFVIALSTAIVLGCGGTPEKTTNVRTADTVDPVEDSEGTVDEASAEMVQMEGLLGTIPQDDVERVMKRKEEKILGCFAEAFEILEEIEGTIEIWMKVGSDGYVTETYLQNGTLGAKVAEDCIVKAVSAFKFPKPSGGGHAEITYPMTFEEPYGHPEPLNWGGGKASAVIGEHADDLERCLKGNTGVQLTLYVSNGGKVVSAGATSDSLDMYDAAQCLAEAAASWTFPDPGERPAKAIVAF